jgi:propionate CoA-transferase
MEIGGKEYLFYPVIPINVAVIRGTTADEDGNITIEREALKLEFLELALAARAAGGSVIVQVEKIVPAGSLPAQSIAVPSIFVDAVILAPQEDRYHWQTLWQPYSAVFSGEAKGPVERDPIPQGLVKVIARRACRELRPGAVVNIGMGISGAVSPVASELGLMKDCTFTIEMGAVGGEPVGYPEFAAVYNPSSFISHVQMFDYYHGHGPDIAFLGAGEIDELGNVNVSRLGPVAGQGGFIDITYKARSIVFCLEFIGGAEYNIGNGQLVIVKDGQRQKFVKRVGQITFSGQRASVGGAAIQVITERVVMEWRNGKWIITEIAPGINLQTDVLPHMQFAPEVSHNLRIMDSNLFC